MVIRYAKVKWNSKYREDQAINSLNGQLFTSMINRLNGNDALKYEKYLI
jgi:hypothetical protein